MAAVRRTCLLDFITFLLCFLFLQHRGCVAAISIWSSNPTTSQNSVYTIGCYVTGRHRDSEIVIGRYLDTGTGRVDEAYHVDQSTTRQESISDYGFPPGSVLDVINNEENNFKLYNISISNGTDKFGAYYCGVNGVDEAKVVTVVNAVKTEALVVPESYSYSISTDDDIRLSVELTGENDPSDLRWRRNSTISVEQWKGLSQVNIDDANSNIPEIYEATLKKKRKGLHAIMLLNVRGCPAGKWGSDCSSDCPRCLNRGICDAKTGNCTCLQGFMGEVCQTACPESYFGTDCDVLCTTDGACAGHYVCQPGPFGCACTAGYHGRNCDLVLPKLSSFPNIENVESNKVTVSWDIWNEQRDVGSGPVIGYVVWYKKSSSDEWFRKPNDRILSTNSTVVDSLKFNTQYEFSVQSVVSDDEVIVRGPTTQKKTKCGTPTVAIANIEVVATGGNSLQVSWQMPDLNKNNMQCKVDSQDTSFVIKYKKDTDVAYERKTVPHDVPHDVPNQTTIHDLESCTNYTIVMVVFNGVSYGPESQVVSGVTSVSDPVEVEDLQVETQQTDATSLHIEWNRPSQCQYEYSYEIKYKLLTKGTCEIADSDWTTPVSVDNNVYDINQLFPNSEYKVCVKSVIGEKESGDVKKSGKTDIAALTDIVQNFSTSSITHNALELTWNRPPCGEPNGPLSYEVNLLEYNNDQFKKKKNQVVSENACKFEKLLIYTRYKATIVAMNNKGNGPPTSIDVQTLQYYPSAPINLSVVRTSLTSIELQWSAPVTPNGIITQYNIEWMLHNTKSNGREPIDAVTRYNMTSLVPDSTYEICVQAVTMVGNGLCSNYIMANTGIPDLQVRLKDRTQRSLTIEWKKQPYHDILSYMITVSLVNRPYDDLYTSTSTVTPFEYSTGKTEVTASQLKSGSEYEIQVQPYFTDGPGSLSKPFRFMTKIKVPLPSDIRLPVLLDSNTLTTQLVLLEPIKSQDAPISSYKVVLRTVKEAKRRKRDDYSILDEDSWQLVDYDSAQQLGTEHYVTAGFDSNALPREFVIGNGELYNEYYNAPLVPGSTYEVFFGMISETELETEAVFTTDPVSFTVDGQSESIQPVILAAVVGVLLVILAGVVTVLCVVWCQRRAKKAQPPVVENGRPPIYLPSKERRQNVKKLVVDAHELQELKQPQIDESHSIKISELAKYVKEKRACAFEGFLEEFESLPQGPKMPYKVCQKSENQNKNRYTNIVSYDHSRVVLDPLPDDPHSDYINANYIDGYRRMNAYIATQGPSTDTIADFWRMVWQQNTATIIMATNLSEMGKPKCAKYWPDESAKYNNLTVILEATQRLADFTHRTFRLQEEESHDIRIVSLFHFTVWPDFGVPMYATAVLSFLKCVKASNPPHAGPMVVHCSAGVGRTGTFIVIDSMLDMIKAEGKVNIFDFVKRIRSQRINMVQVLDQYTFIYEAVLEASLCGDTSISTSDYRIKLYKLKQINSRTNQNAIFQEFQNLSVVCPVPEPDECQAGHVAENRAKNRFPNIIPVDQYRPYLMNHEDSEDNYINASFLDAYKQKNAFLATQMPLPNTIDHFWRMIHNYKSCSIVMLNAMDKTDESLGQYWPDEGSLEFGPFTVELVSNSNYGGIICRILKLYPTGYKEGDNIRTVQQFFLTCWPLGHEVPQSKPAVMDLVSLVEKWQQKTGNGPITVHCLNGLGRSGTFCALYAVIERIKVEQVVDVFQAVKKLRINRPNMVQNLDQYNFCYDAVLEFLDSFEAYANFK